MCRLLHDRIYTCIVRTRHKPLIDRLTEYAISVERLGCSIASILLNNKEYKTSLSLIIYKLTLFYYTHT